MPRIFQTILWFLLLPSAMAAPAQYAFRISFRDKTGAPQLTAQPAWLSARAVSRRATFGIILDSTDRPVSPVYVDSVLLISGGKLHNTSRWLNQCVILLTDTTPVATLRAKSWIRSAEWVGYFSTGLHQKQVTGRNPKLETVEPITSYPTAKQAGSSSFYGASWGQTNMVHGDTLHDQGFKGKGKLIALLDAGYSGANTHRGFDSIRRQGRLLETYNFVLDTSFVYAYDDHGTHCYSTIGGLISGTFVGTAPDAQFALYVTEDNNFTDALYELDNLVAGMERADSLGADIISASLGYNLFTSPYSTGFSKTDLNGIQTSVARAVNMATAKGILYVTSAGNEGGNSWNYLVSPADADSALTVGSVTSTRAPSSFSSPGPNMAGRVKPDVCLQGDPAAVLTAGGGVGTAPGTSFAAPQAAGYAACLMQAYPMLPPAIIRKTIDSISHLSRAPTPKLGYGIPDFRKAQPFLRRLLFPDSILEVTIIPNPFNTSITVQLPKASSTVEAAFWDMSGQKIGLLMQRDADVVSLSPYSGLSGGIYVLRLIIDGTVYTRKLVHANQ
jgi:hypothetical protein